MKYIRAILFLFMYIGIILGFSFFLNFFIIPVYASMIAMILGGITIICLYSYNLGDTIFENIKLFFIEILNINKFTLLVIFKSICFGVLTLVFMILFHTLIPSGYAEQNEFTQRILGSDNLFQTIIMFIYSVFFASIFEEIVFRGILHHKGVGWFFSSFVFAILHIDFGNISATSNSIIFFTSFVAGVIFYFLYVRYKTIIAPIIAHSTYNLIVLLIVLFL